MTFKEKFDEYVKDYANVAGYSCCILIYMLILEYFQVEYNGLQAVRNIHAGFFTTTFLLKMYGR